MGYCSAHTDVTRWMADDVESISYVDEFDTGVRANSIFLAHSPWLMQYLQWKVEQWVPRIQCHDGLAECFR